MFRDVIAFEPRAAQKGEMIERLMRKILGPQLILSSSHGSLVTKDGGVRAFLHPRSACTCVASQRLTCSVWPPQLQEIHQDQGSVPLPHPSYPLVSLLIWCYSDFSKDEGGTYL